jgi:integrase
LIGNAFERSRAVAEAKLEQIVKEARSKRDSVRLVEKLYEIKTGEQIKSVMLDELPAEWARIPRKRKPNPRYASQCQSALKRFAGFVRKENPKADELAHVTRVVARAFLDAEAERGVTAKTWNDTLKLLRATFKYLLPAGAINPFADTPAKETETVFRKPFTPEEMKAIVDSARDDDFIRTIIVTGMCTAMRRGDCCLLKWKDIDLARRFITVKTAKTGVTVSIPIFPMLYEELRALSEEHENQKSEVGGQTSERGFGHSRGRRHPEQAGRRPTLRQGRRGRE